MYIILEKYGAIITYVIVIVLRIIHTVRKNSNIGILKKLKASARQLHHERTTISVQMPKVDETFFVLDVYAETGKEVQVKLELLATRGSNCSCGHSN